LSNSTPTTTGLTAGRWGKQYDAPAAILLSDFDATARNVTWDYYRSIPGMESVSPKDLHPVDELIARSQN
jgi:hypothetical protein